MSMAGSLAAQRRARSYDAVMSADPAEPYEVIHLGGRAAAVVPLDDLGDLEERLAVAKYLADKEGMRSLAVTDDELDGELDRLDAAGS